MLAEDCILPRGEFLLGGEIVEGLSDGDRKTLTDAGAVQLSCSPSVVLVEVTLVGGFGAGKFESGSSTRER